MFELQKDGFLGLGRIVSLLDNDDVRAAFSVFPVALNGLKSELSGLKSGRRIWFADKAKKPLKSAVYAYT